MGQLDILVNNAGVQRHAAFLDAQAAEAGAARNTLIAYERDLRGASELLGGRLVMAEPDNLSGLGAEWMELKRATVARSAGSRCQLPTSRGAPSAPMTLRARTRDTVPSGEANSTTATPSASRDTRSKRPVRRSAPEAAAAAYDATVREIGWLVRRTTQAGTDPVAAVDARTVEVRLSLSEEGRAALERRTNMQVQVAIRP